MGGGGERSAPSAHHTHLISNACSFTPCSWPPTWPLPQLLPPPPASQPASQPAIPYLGVGHSCYTPPPPPQALSQASMPPEVMDQAALALLITRPIFDPDRWGKGVGGGHMCTHTAITHTCTHARTHTHTTQTRTHTANTHTHDKEVHHTHDRRVHNTHRHTQTDTHTHRKHTHTRTHTYLLMHACLCTHTELTNVVMYTSGLLKINAAEKSVNASRMRMRCESACPVEAYHNVIQRNTTCLMHSGAF